MPTENLRFRDTSLTFKVAETALEEEIKRMCRYEYPQMYKKLGELRFCVIIVMSLAVCYTFILLNLAPPGSICKGG